ncbi:hypothetical protein HanXRQr2_Chr09g0373351 [Helianthus annuus]|uniref:Uncharacterized protein n=1 Tax=Helianthus annuus TaxID=4232 RepID=A0A9K3I4D3_HELAN|nr:hypothetical protein HanXRQr2_Chr09g0373351 [Helianthus annuus]
MLVRVFLIKKMFYELLKKLNFESKHEVCHWYVSSLLIYWHCGYCSGSHRLKGR